MGAQCYTSRPISDTLNPKWNFNCQFFIKDLYQDVLCITVSEKDQFSPDGQWITGTHTELIIRLLSNLSCLYRMKGTHINPWVHARFWCLLLTCCNRLHISLSTIVLCILLSLFSVFCPFVMTVMCWLPWVTRCMSGCSAQDKDVDVSAIYAFCLFRLPGSHRSSRGNYKERDGEQRCCKPSPATARSPYWRGLGETRPTALWANQMRTTHSQTHPRAHTT